MAECSPRPPCAPGPRRELGRRAALLALLRHPAPGGAGRVSALDAVEDEGLPRRVEGAEQDFLLLAVFLQMCRARFADGLASCNDPASPGEEGTMLQPNSISLNLLQDCLRLLRVLARPPRAGSSADTLEPVPPFRNAPLSSPTLTGGLFARGFAPSTAGFAEEVAGDAAATCRPGSREEAVSVMSFFPHPPLSDRNPCLALEARSEPWYGVWRTSSMGCGHHRCPQCQAKVEGPGPSAANLPVPAGIR